MAISKKQWLAVARQAQAGVSQVTPGLFLPAKATFKNMKKRIYFSEDRNTRDENNQVVDGARHSEGEIDTSWYNDAAPYLLLAFMGADAPSQPASGTDPTVWLHNMSLTDNPLPLDFWKGYDSDSLGFAYGVPYDVVKSVKLSWNAGESDKGLQVKVSTLGQPFAKTTNGLKSAPATPAPTNVGTGGTVLAGVYKVMVTYVDGSGNESAPSAAGSTTTSGSTSVITVPSPSAQSPYVSYYVYCSQAGGSTLTRQQALGSPTTLGTSFTLSAPPTSTGASQPATLIPTFSSYIPFAGWQPTIQFNGAASSDIEQVEIDLEQAWTLWFPSNGAQTWVTAYPGKRTAKLSFEARFDNDTLYQKYNANTGVDDHINVAFNGSVISHAYLQNLTLDFPIVGYDDMEHNDGKDNITIKAKATVRPGITANSLFTASVQNTVASYAQ